LRATNSGIFQISVRDINGGPNMGAYRLTVVKTGSPLTISEQDEGGALTNGVTYVGSIDIGDIDAWSITANAGEHIIARMGESSSELSPQLRLYDPSGALLGNSGNPIGAEVVARATNSGTFLLVAGDISSSWAGTGNYRLTMAKTGSSPQISGGDEGGALTNALTHTGSIETGDIDTYTIRANAGEHIVARMGELTTGSLTPELRLYGPSGAVVDISPVSLVATEVIVRAPSSGEYLLVAGDTSSGWSGTGDYRLTSAKTGSPLTISPSDEGGSLTNGLTHVGSIETGDIDVWSIEARAGESIVARMGEITPGLSPELRLFDPAGGLIGNNLSTIAAEVAVRATNSGTFLLIAGDRTGSWSGTGNYRLTMAKTGGPISISPADEGGAMVNGTAYLGSIETGDVDAWTFSARTGDNIVVRMGEVASSSTLTRNCVYSVKWSTSRYIRVRGGRRGSQRATNAGEYLVIAGDQSGSFAVLVTTA
jgi:hypothetical protein